MTVQADGKVLLGGLFNGLQPNGAASATTRNYIARVNADGTLDTGFDPNADFNVLSVAVQADGKVLLGGIFSTLQPNGAASATLRVGIARVNADGTLDPGFDPNANARVLSVAVQADGKVLLGGFFTSLQPNGAASPTTRNFFARLANDPATQSLTAVDTTQALWSRSGAGPELSATTFEQSTDGGTTWIAIGSGTRVGTTANWQLTGLSLPSIVSIRARGRTTGGYLSGSSGLIEQVAAFTGLPTPAPTVTLSTENLPANAPTLTITGTGFDATTPGNNTVVFTPTGTGIVTAATPTSLTVTSLTGLTPGALSAVVTTNGQDSGIAVQVGVVNTTLETWRQLYYGSTATNTGDAANTADPHHTDIPNLLVFAFLGPNQNPATATVSQLPTNTTDPGFLTYQFTGPAGVSGITYGAEWSTTLQANDWQPVTDTGSAPEHIFRLPLGSDRKFLRLTVTPQE